MERKVEEDHKLYIATTLKKFLVEEYGSVEEAGRR